MDGKITVVDVIRLNKGIAGKLQMNAQQTANADCNGDGTVDTSDVTSLLKFIVSLVDALPSA